MPPGMNEVILCLLYVHVVLRLCASDPADAGRGQCECSSAPAAWLSRGKLLLHCFLQGLKAGLSEGTGTDNYSNELRNELRHFSCVTPNCRNTSTLYC